MRQNGSIVLIEPDETNREVLGARLRMQGYDVTAVASPADGALSALSSPPSAVVADLWMPSISGVQLCRLLKAEPATCDVAVILRGPEGQRHRFWAERAGAAEYVAKGRMGDLVRALSRAIAAVPPSSGFFMHLSETTDIRDRIASYLDAALFESVVAAEVRALSLCAEHERLFDLFTQFMCRVFSYRWLALQTHSPAMLALHTHPARRAVAEREARAAFGIGDDTPFLVVEDEDPCPEENGPSPVVTDVKLVDVPMGRMAVAGREAPTERDLALLEVIGRELGGPIRMATLVEEARRLATVDPLTGLMNRRAFLSAVGIELERSQRLGYTIGFVLLDVDHFKLINDRHGHASGDAVLRALGKLLGNQLRKVDLLARWGGEEFLIALSGCDGDGGVIAAERLRRAIEDLHVVSCKEDVRIPVTVSLGVTTHRAPESLEAAVDRADRAMYAAKSGGRNRVMIFTDKPAEAESAREAAE